MPDSPTPDFGFINSIKDPQVKSALLRVMKHIATTQTELAAQLGKVNRPLDAHLDANSKLLTNLMDPVNAQDAVTKKWLQQYVASAFSNFTGQQAAGGGGTGGDGGGGGDVPDDGIPDHSDVVNSVFAASPIGPGSTLDQIFRFTQTVAWTLANGSYGDPAGLLAGLLNKDAGENIFTCGGVSYSISRICYSNGHLFKVVGDAGPGGGNTPQWNSDSPLLPDAYRAATDPSAPC